MEHPITPPDELVLQWVKQWQQAPYQAKDIYRHIAAAAAQWGADQELEACCEWAVQNGYNFTTIPIRLRSARRPKPPSLKEQALGAMGRFTINAHMTADEMSRDFDTIRRALEQLND